MEKKSHRPVKSQSGQSLSERDQLVVVDPDEVVRRGVFGEDLGEFVVYRYEGSVESVLEAASTL
jgi:hypothetical protein